MKSYRFKTPGVIFIFAFAFASLQINPTPVFACSCAKPGTPTQELKISTAVFSGKVIQISEVKIGNLLPKRKVKFNVENSWKAITQKTVSVLTGFGEGDCGFKFEKGESYLVYARGSKDALSTSTCGRTKKLAEAREDLSELGPAAVDLKGKLATTWGSIKRTH